MTDSNGNFLVELQNRLQSSSDLISDDFVEDNYDEEEEKEKEIKDNEKFLCSFPGCKLQFYHAPCCECTKLGERDNCYCELHESHEVHNLLPTNEVNYNENALQNNQTQEFERNEDNLIEIDLLNQTQELKRIENDLKIQSTSGTKKTSPEFKNNQQQLECYNLLKGIPNVLLNICLC
jgi:hypothetical protein